jgi:hypothetical protein
MGEDTKCLAFLKVRTRLPTIAAPCSTKMALCGQTARETVSQATLPFLVSIGVTIVFGSLVDDDRAHHS